VVVSHPENQTANMRVFCAAVEQQITCTKTQNKKHQELLIFFLFCQDLSFFSLFIYILVHFSTLISTVHQQVEK